MKGSENRPSSEEKVQNTFFNKRLHKLHRINVEIVLRGEFARKSEELLLVECLLTLIATVSRRRNLALAVRLRDMSA